MNIDPSKMTMEEMRKIANRHTRITKAARRRGLIQLGSMQGNAIAARARQERDEHGHIITPLHKL